MKKSNEIVELKKALIDAFRKVVTTHVPRPRRQDPDVVAVQQLIGDEELFDLWAPPTGSHWMIKRATVKNYHLLVDGLEEFMLTHDEICHRLNTTAQRLSMLLSAGGGMARVERYDGKTYEITKLNYAGRKSLTMQRRHDELKLQQKNSGRSKKSRT